MAFGSDSTEVEDDGRETTPPELKAVTYEAKLHTPLYYASKEGREVETDSTISATAIMHAIGYRYYNLQKDFLLVGDEATTPAYERLRSLPIFTSEMVPLNASVDEDIMRTVSYGTERALVTDNPDVGKFIRGAKGSLPRRIEGSNTAWHRMRRYTGLSPGSTFEFTIWAPQEEILPNKLRFRAGIKRTGELTAHKQATPADRVTLNKYLLESTYGIDESVLFELLEEAERLSRGDDPRAIRFENAPRSWVDENLIPDVLAETPG